VLDEALGPDPEPCSDQTGPLPGQGSNAIAGSGSSNSNATGGSSTSSSTPSSAPSSNTTPTTVPTGPNSGVGGLSQLLEPLLGGLS
jgi:hypothetical protein